jgi:hypothetical protein
MDSRRVPNQISQEPGDAVQRREQLKRIAELGLQHSERERVGVTVLGHEILLRDHVAYAVDVVMWADKFITRAVADLPYPSMIWAAVSLVLPLLKNPFEEEVANQEGFQYVTLQMRYYAAMETLWLPQYLNRDLKENLEERVVDLYKLIIDFQVQTVLRFYQSRTKNYFKDLVKYDGWEDLLSGIRAVEDELDRKFGQVMAGTNLAKLEELVQEAVARRKNIDALIAVGKDHLQVGREQRDILGEMFKRGMSQDDEKWLDDLHITDPHLDKARIKDMKGGLLRESYQWILDDPLFKQWRHDPKARKLWVKGDPGTGKTMLLCGIVDELEQSSTPHSLLSFFFCQSGDSRINNATAVLRGMIYRVVKQQPSLISLARKKYGTANQLLSDNVNSFYALSEVINEILAGTPETRMCFVIDALDECDTGLELLLGLIDRLASKYPRTTWLLSSRRGGIVEKQLGSDGTSTIELDRERMSHAVDKYIEYQTSHLPSLRDDQTLRAEVYEQMRRKADGTFLWAAHVFGVLQRVESWDVLDVLEEMPAGLIPLYDRMMDHIRKLERNAPEYCRLVLSTVVVAFRPLHLLELGVLSGIPGRISNNPKSLSSIVNMCGSFLTLREDHVYVIHQSAKDYLVHNVPAEILPQGLPAVHFEIGSRSLHALSQKLRRNMCDLQHAGPLVSAVDLSQLTPVRYSCVFWVDHLCNADPERLDLADGGQVHLFLQKFFLYWLEALSLQKSMPDGVIAMARLEDLMRVSTTLPSSASKRSMTSELN